MTAPGPAPTAAGTAFDRAIAVAPARVDPATGVGAVVGHVDPAWGAPTGPNGGYLAAIAVRALDAVVDPDAALRLRSLTVHYLRSARGGALELTVEPLRRGRRITSARFLATQEGRPVLTGVAAYAAPGLDEPARWAPSAPDVAPPPSADATCPAADYRRDTDAWLEPTPEMPPVVHRLRVAPRIGGPPFGGRTPTEGHPAVAGGWVALPEPRPIDAVLAVLATDAWWPAAFEAVSRPVIAPTIDLTIHLRADLPPGGLAPTPLLAEFRTATAAGGLVEEDGRVFLPDGTLVAQSRQLALLAPVG